MASGCSGSGIHTCTGSCQKDSKFVVFHPTRVPHRTPVAHDRLWTDHHGCNGARQRSRRQHQGRTARQRQRRRRTGTPRAAGTTEKQPSSTRQQQRWHQDSKHWISLRPRRSMSPWCMHHAPWLLHSASLSGGASYRAGRGCCRARRGGRWSCNRCCRSVESHAIWEESV